MDYRCRLVRKFIHCFGALRPLGKIGLSYSFGLWDFIFSCPLYFFPCSRISSYLLFLCLISFLLFPCAMFGKTLVHEFLISYSHTEWLSFFRQCNYKCTKENSVRDDDTSPSTCNPVSTRLNWVTLPFCMALRSFGPTSYALVDYHLERGGMPLHDSVGVNCERGETTENHGADTWYMG